MTWRRLHAWVGGLLVAGAAGFATLAGEVKTPEWRFPEAHTRLLTAPAMDRSHTLRVDLPANLAQPVGSFRIVGPDGKPLRGTALYEGERLAAIEIRVPLRGEEDEASRQMQALSLPIEVYLFAKEARPTPDPLRTPVVLRVGVGHGVARPGSGADFLAFYQNLRPLTFRNELLNISDDEIFERLPNYVTKNQKLVYHLSTLWSCPVEREINFAVLNDNNGAWFLFLDQQPVFSWVEAARDDRQRLISPNRVIDAGLHRVDLFGVLKEGEAAPTLAFRAISEDAQYQRFAASELWSPNGATRLFVEAADAVLAPGFRVDALETYAFLEAKTVLTKLRFTDLTTDLLRRRLPSRQTRLGQEPRARATESFELYLPRMPWTAVSLDAVDDLGFAATLSANLSLPWTEPKPVNVVFQPTAMAHLAPGEEPVAIDYYLAVSASFHPELMSLGRLRLSRYDRDGARLSVEDLPIPRSPFRRSIRVDQVDAATARMRLALVLDDQPICPPVDIQVVSPGDEPRFKASAAMLRYGEGIAMLRRETPGQAVPALPSRKIGQALLVDDFIATAGHALEADGDESLWGGADRGLHLGHLPLHVRPLASSYRPFAKFVNLAEVRASTADTVVWATGISEIEAGMSVQDFRGELAFLAESCLRWGKLPVLVTPPIAGAFTQERLRIYALTVLELAAEYRLPVVDLYSASLKRRNVDAFYRIEGRDDLLSATPNARGRAWFCQQIATTIEHYNRGLIAP